MIRKSCLGSLRVLLVLNDSGAFPLLFYDTVLFCKCSDIILIVTVHAPKKIHKGIDYSYVLSHNSLFDSV